MCNNTVNVYLGYGGAARHLENSTVKKSPLLLPGVAADKRQIYGRGLRGVPVYIKSPPVEQNIKSPSAVLTQALLV